MKSITIPESIQLTIQTSDQPKNISFGLLDLIIWAIDSEPAFSNSSKALRQSSRIEAALRSLKEDSKELVLDDEDVAALKTALDAPSKGYPISPARRLLPLIDAIDQAKPYVAPTKSEQG